MPCWQAADSSRELRTRRTVSYTHLDVYKRQYIDPTEPAASYDELGRRTGRAASSALRGVGEVWASAQDISFWDIGLAGGVLIHEPEHRKLVYAPWNLPDGREVPGVAGWQFYKHRGLMDIKGSVPGSSCLLYTSRCV